MIGRSCLSRGLQIWIMVGSIVGESIEYANTVLTMKNLEIRRKRFIVI
jgi:hypothetical protein